MNIAIIRAFISLRQYAINQNDTEKQIAELEARFQREFADIHEALRWLAAENQSRADDIVSLQESNDPETDWGKPEVDQF